MKKLNFTLFLMLISLQLFAQERDWADCAKYAQSNKEVKKGAKAVFMGNSITEQWVGCHPEFFSDNQFIGRGISGQTTAHMLVRFRNDVIELAPRNVVILAGTNDIAQNNGYISNRDIVGNIASMCDLAKANKIKVVLCSILPAAEYPWRNQIDAVGNIREVNRMLKEYAKQNKITYVDLYEKMKDSRNGLSKELSSDEVHLTPKGYEVMEQILLPYIK